MAGAPLASQQLHDAGSAFATLHGPASQVLREDRVRRLFRAGIAWVLTVGAPQSPFVPANQAAQSIVATVLQRPDALAALALARADWRDAQIVHGDAKAANVLVLADGAVRVIDWEIAALGDGLWDIAGLVQSLLMPNPMVAPDTLDVAQPRAQALIEALWAGYVAVLPPPAHLGDARVTLLRLTGARMLQTCLEWAQVSNQIYPQTPNLLQMALELLTRPEAWRQRWERAA
jgi:Ser/Thr protein kinase RdoA (MazF antagonist)